MDDRDGSKLGMGAVGPLWGLHASGLPLQPEAIAGLDERARAQVDDLIQTLAIALDTSRLGVWQLDLLNGSLACTPQCKVHAGLVPDALLTYEYIDSVTHPDDRAHVLATFQAAVAGHAEYDIEYRIFWPDGSIHWMLSRGQVIYDGAGMALRMVGVTLDTSERRSAEEEQRFFARVIAQLHAVATDLAGALTPEEVAAVIIRHSSTGFGAVGGTVALVVPDHGAPRVIGAASHSSEAAAAQQSIALHASGPCAQAARTGALMLLESRQQFLAHYPQLADVLANSELHAWAYVPLFVAARVVGVLGLSFNVPHSFPAEEREFLQTFAQQCAQALDRARLYDAERQAHLLMHEELAQRRRAELRQQLLAERTARLQRVTAELASALSSAQVAEIVASQCCNAVEASSCEIGILGEGGELDLFGLRAMGLPLHRSAVLLNLDLPSPMADVIRSGELVQLETPAALAEAYPALATRAAEPTAALIAVPIPLGAHIFGAIVLGFQVPRHLAEDEVALLVAVAQQCAQALERAALYQAERSARLIAEEVQRQQMLLANAMSAFAEAGLDLDEVIERVVRQSVTIFGDGCSIRLLSADQTQFLASACFHADPEAYAALQELHASEPRAADSSLGELVSRSEPLLIAAPTLLRGQLWEAALPYVKRFGVHSLMVAPLCVQGKAIGLLTLVRDRTTLAFTRADQMLLAELANRAAIVIVSARLYADEQHARAEAEAAVRMRDVFFSVAAHELKTPLTSLLGQAQLLFRRMQREGQSNERNLHSADVVVGQAQRLNRMITAVLDMSRLEYGQLSIERQPIDLCGLVQQVVAEMQPLLGQHQIECAASPGSIPILGDALRIEQVLQNLLGNAVKYSPAGGVVQVLFQREPGLAGVTVIDSGIGIPAEAMSQLFSRFYRADNATAQHIGGMGIGLYVVNEIVTLHGGRVDVRSVQGQGSAFTVWLPSM